MDKIFTCYNQGPSTPNLIDIGLVVPEEKIFRELGSYYKVRNLTRKTCNLFFEQISWNEQTTCSQVSWIQISHQIMSPIYGFREDFFVFWPHKVTVTYFFKQGLQFEQTWIGPGHICFCVSFIKICPVVSEELLILWVDGLMDARMYAWTDTRRTMP